MKGMNALRLHTPVDEKNKLIKYDALQCFNRKDLENFLIYLTKRGIKFWIYNGDLYTYDKKFGEVVKDWLYGED